MRERSVLRLAAQDLSCDEIARTLGISRLTVEGHRKSALRKFNLSGKAGFQKLLVSLEPYLNRMNIGETR